MFKVKKEEFTNKTFRMPNDLIEQLQSVAQEQSVSLNQLVIQCCQYALDNLEK
ncbi:toxin-antitoxin system HicB family antitoxin [uncultured Eubacterium sp.]|uniref:toxin-antitoxin system HicB family antitoxin n=1 Tax=uncultured Eubacterium sp. TaxID=165185 RepID=UPI0015ABF7DB|nr:toxin-antitoxin system HicB family antitoxin [uncultured Eubacterium sp.]MDO4363639.1 toxin-antitoxin system HicB family antitoxin [Clostridia bacterium]